MAANESGLSLTVSHLQQQAEPLRAVDKHQKLQFLMEHRVPFILRCVLGPNEIRRVHERESYEFMKYGPDCAPKMDKLIPTINCFTLAPPTSEISKVLSDGDNREGIYLIYSGFSYFLRAGDGAVHPPSHTAPLKCVYLRRWEEDQMCFLFEFVPLNGGHFAIRSRAYSWRNHQFQAFLRYVESNESNNGNKVQSYKLQH